MNLKLSNIVIYLIFHELVNDIEGNSQGTQVQIGILPTHLGNMLGDLIVAALMKGHQIVSLWNGEGGLRLLGQFFLLPAHIRPYHIRTKIFQIFLVERDARW